MMAEHLVNAEYVIGMNVLDKALGEFTYAERVELASKIEKALEPIYSSANWHVKLKEIAQKNGFRTAGERMFESQQLSDAIEARLEYLSEILDMPIEELKADYSERIERVTEYLESIGGKITTDEQMRKVNVILMGNETAYKTVPVIAGINALQRAPFRLRNVIDEHREILGVHIDETDMLGYENFNVFFQVGVDPSGERFHYIYHRHQPQNSSLSNMVRENAGKDSNPYGMWDFGLNNWADLTREQAEEQINILIAKDTALRMSRNYAPKFGNYSMEKAESRENFMTEWQERSLKEDEAYNVGMSRESRLTAEERHLRNKNLSLIHI